MLLRIFAAIVGLAVLLGGLVGIKALQIKALSAGGAHAQTTETVASSTAEIQTWENLIDSIGTLRAVNGVQLAAEASGAVERIGFTSGATAKEGDILLQLDLSVEKAQLDAARSRLELAKINARRQAELIATSSTTQSDVDSANATLAAAEADMARILAEIDRRVLRAPFAGTLGIRQVNVGQYLQAGTPVVSLQALDRMLVDFNLPQQRIKDVKPGLTVRLTTDAHPGKTFEGRLTAVQPDIDTTSRNLAIEAEFANPEGLLLPGMFANVVIVQPEASKVVAIPATAVIYAPYGDSVYVIEEATDEKDGSKHLAVRREIVRLGRTRGDLVEVKSGLKGGETVVSSGAFKLRNGMRVVINNEGAPVASPTPTPPNT